MSLWFSFLWNSRRHTGAHLTPVYLPWWNVCSDLLPVFLTGWFPCRWVLRIFAVLCSSPLSDTCLPTLAANLRCLFFLLTVSFKKQKFSILINSLIFCQRKINIVMHTHTRTISFTFFLIKVLFFFFLPDCTSQNFQDHTEKPLDLRRKFFGLLSLSMV